MSGGLLLAPYAARVATATAAAPSTSPAGPAGSVRFLTAENFWADWSPYASTALSQLRLERQVYDYLVDFPSGDLAQPEPMLATAWQQVDDLTWEFELRDGVTFHEGEPFTADDVKASLELATGFSGESAYAINWVPVEVEVVDPLTVRLKHRATVRTDAGRPLVVRADPVRSPARRRPRSARDPAERHRPVPPRRGRGRDQDDGGQPRLLAGSSEDRDVGLGVHPGSADPPQRLARRVGAGDRPGAARASAPPRRGG